ncbi:MAG TPA: arylamine N-acetyltransferase [Thermoanaerobaculia bacterium]|nr:arylamine N-acetyltransferase [Thermoanaerobaculia bacterium]
MIDRYLQRIAYDGSREPTAATLRALQVQHLLHVPFENLDIHWKRRIVVDTERFLHKIIDERRGGFCYELNGAFAWLLRGLGFEVKLLEAQAPTPDGGMGPPFDHMALLVNDEWLADVGFGDFSMYPIHVSEVRDGEVRLNGKLEYLLSLEPHELHEFAAMCDYQQFDPGSSFTKKRVCTIATPDGRITLSDTKLIVTKNGVRTETPVSAEEWNDVLLATFGITPVAAS